MKDDDKKVRPYGNNLEVLVSIRVSEKTSRQLDALAKKHNISRPHAVRMILEKAGSA